MRILFLTENFPPETNAAATRVYERACYWAKWGHDVTILTCAPNFPQGRLFDGYQNRWHQMEDMDGLRVVRVKTYIAANRGTLLRTLDFASFMIMAVGAGLFEKRPDVIVSTSPQFFVAVSGWMLGALRRVPFVFELGDLWPASIVAVGAMQESLAIRILERIELLLYRRSAAVIALTHAFKTNLVARGIPAEKIAVVINGVDLWRYGARSPDTELLEAWDIKDQFVIGYVGTHGMAHGLMNVLDAAALLSERTDIAFLLVGAGAEREALMLESEARGLENVIFMPPQPKDAMPAVWSLCQVALVHLRNSPAFEDVIPSKMFEAMGMGLPIILALPSGEARDILEADGAGIYVPPENATALAAAVTRLADKTKLYQRLRAQSMAAAPGHSRETQAEHMICALKAVIEGKGIRVAEIPIPDVY